VREVRATGGRAGRGSSRRRRVLFGHLASRNPYLASRPCLVARGSPLYSHVLDSTLIYETRTFSPSVHARQRNPAKVYLVDTGLARRITSTDLGHLLENAVFLELKRRGYEMSHFEGEREVDFLARRDGEDMLPVQVTWELIHSNRDREIEGLLQACRVLSLREGLILTDDQEEDIEQGGVRISVRAALRWMLET